MAKSSRIRVGIVGASASRRFASIAHIPALRATGSPFRPSRLDRCVHHHFGSCLLCVAPAVGRLMFSNLPPFGLVQLQTLGGV